MNLRNLFVSMLFCAALPLQAEPLTIQVKADRPAALYRCGETATFTVSAVRDGQPVQTGTLPYSLQQGRNVITTGVIDLAQPSATVSGTLETPGFLLCVVGAKKEIGYGGAAFEPEKITPAMDNEAADFDAFWAEGKKLQDSMPPITVEKLDAYSNDQYQSTLLTIPTVDGKQIHAFLCEPTAPGVHPLLISVHGAGPGFVAPDTAYAKEGVITLSICTHDYRPVIGDAAATKKLFAAAYQSYSGLRVNTDDPRKHIYYRTHLGVRRAIEKVTAQPNVDRHHVVFTGGSQGGTYAIAMTALNPTITAAAAMVPGFADHGGWLKGTGNSHLLSPSATEPEKQEAMINTAAYFDSAYFARRIKVPVIFSAGFVDRTCTPHSVYAAYNLIAAPKEMIDCPEAGHGIPADMAAARDRWLREKLGLGPKL
jgi:cephalosporin-C deacetylase-like acetyl esterase